MLMCPPEKNDATYRPLDHLFFAPRRPIRAGDGRLARHRPRRRHSACPGRRDRRHQLCRSSGKGRGGARVRAYGIERSRPRQARPYRRQGRRQQRAGRSRDVRDDPGALEASRLPGQQCGLPAGIAERGARHRHLSPHHRRQSQRRRALRPEGARAFRCARRRRQHHQFAPASTRSSRNPATSPIPSARAAWPI
ncbi:hypothetical protein ACVWZ6_008290 [Bradyrhizobium sp. GM6.1]